MNNAAMMIAATEAQDKCRGEPDIIERLRKAMNATKDHWMVTDYEMQFKAALAAAMMESPPDDKARIQRGLERMGRVAAMLRALQVGVAVDLDAEATAISEEEPLPLGKMWREIAGEPGR